MAKEKGEEKREKLLLQCYAALASNQILTMLLWNGITTEEVHDCKKLLINHSKPCKLAKTVRTRPTLRHLRVAGTTGRTSTKTWTWASRGTAKAAISEKKATTGTAFQGHLCSRVRTWVRVRVPFEHHSSPFCRSFSALEEETRSTRARKQSRVAGQACWAARTATAPNAFEWQDPSGMTWSGAPPEARKATRMVAVSEG